ncbi:hypothetical protein BLNAU_10348 [Blattamonas nauphoetae]|uniref:Protein kinase domain-containing protein n=1 Tax=Blattamonas nauphoetae TaxID=2049346 RepID=A0ABQ9XT80_9EUKA|nr:hypothetical protein BLNAU_10348 [Blattamonas nauphoetae]
MSSEEPCYSTHPAASTIVFSYPILAVVFATIALAAWVFFWFLHYFRQIKAHRKEENSKALAKEATAKTINAGRIIGWVMLFYEGFQLSSFSVLDGFQFKENKSSPFTIGWIKQIMDIVDILLLQFGQIMPVVLVVVFIGVLIFSTVWTTCMKKEFHPIISKVIFDMIYIPSCRSYFRFLSFKFTCTYFGQPGSFVPYPSMHLFPTVPLSNAFPWVMFAICGIAVALLQPFTFKFVALKKNDADPSMRIMPKYFLVFYVAKFTMVAVQELFNFPIAVLIVNLIIIMALLVWHVHLQPCLGFGLRVNNVRSALFFGEWTTALFSLFAEIWKDQTEIFVVLMITFFVLGFVCVFVCNNVRAKRKSFPEFKLIRLLTGFSIDTRLTACSTVVQNVTNPKPELYDAAISSLLDIVQSSSISPDQHKEAINTLVIASTHVEGPPSFARVGAVPTLVKYVIQKKLSSPRDLQSVKEIIENTREYVDMADEEFPPSVFQQTSDLIFFLNAHDPTSQFLPLLITYAANLCRSKHNIVWLWQSSIPHRLERISSKTDVSQVLNQLLYTTTLLNHEEAAPLVVNEFFDQVTSFLVSPLRTVSGHAAYTLVSISSKWTVKARQGVYLSLAEASKRGTCLVDINTTIQELKDITPDDLSPTKLINPTEPKQGEIPRLLEQVSYLNEEPKPWPAMARVKARDRPDDVDVFEGIEERDRENMTQLFYFDRSKRMNQKQIDAEEITFKAAIETSFDVMKQSDIRLRERMLKAAVLGLPPPDIKDDLDGVSGEAFISTFKRPGFSSLVGGDYNFDEDLDPSAEINFDDQPAHVAKKVEPKLMEVVLADNPTLSVTVDQSHSIFNQNKAQQKEHTTMVERQKNQKKAVRAGVSLAKSLIKLTRQTPNSPIIKNLSAHSVLLTKNGHVGIHEPEAKPNGQLVFDGQADIKRYQAPETSTSGQFSEKSTVFTMGSILYQMLAGQPPFAETDSISVVRKFQSNDRPNLDVFGDMGLAEVIKGCWEAKPADRPDLEDLVRQLDDLENTLNYDTPKLPPLTGATVEAENMTFEDAEKELNTQITADQIMDDETRILNVGKNPSRNRAYMSLQNKQKTVQELLELKKLHRTTLGQTVASQSGSGAIKARNQKQSGMDSLMLSRRDSFSSHRDSISSNDTGSIMSMPTNVHQESSQRWSDSQAVQQQPIANPFASNPIHDPFARASTPPPPPPPDDDLEYLPTPPLNDLPAIPPPPPDAPPQGDPFDIPPPPDDDVSTPRPPDPLADIPPTDFVETAPHIVLKMEDSILGTDHGINLGEIRQFSHEIDHIVAYVSMDNKTYLPAYLETNKVLGVNFPLLVRDKDRTSRTHKFLVNQPVEVVGCFTKPRDRSLLNRVQCGQIVVRRDQHTSLLIREELSLGYLNLVENDSLEQLVTKGKSIDSFKTTAEAVIIKLLWDENPYKSGRLDQLALTRTEDVTPLERGLMKNKFVLTSLSTILKKRSINVSNTIADLRSPHIEEAIRTTDVVQNMFSLMSHRNSDDNMRRTLLKTLALIVQVPDVAIEIVNSGGSGRPKLFLFSVFLPALDGGECFASLVETIDMCLRRNPHLFLERNKRKDIIAELRIAHLSEYAVAYRDIFERCAATAINAEELITGVRYSFGVHALGASSSWDLSHFEHHPLVLSEYLGLIKNQFDDPSNPETIPFFLPIDRDEILLLVESKTTQYFDRRYEDYAEMVTFPEMSEAEKAFIGTDSIAMTLRHGLNSLNLLSNLCFYSWNYSLMIASYANPTQMSTVSLIEKGLKDKTSKDMNGYDDGDSQDGEPAILIMLENLLRSKIPDVRHYALLVLVGMLSASKKAEMLDNLTTVESDDVKDEARIKAKGAQAHARKGIEAVIIKKISASKIPTAVYNLLVLDNDPVTQTLCFDLLQHFVTLTHAHPQLQLKNVLVFNVFPTPYVINLIASYTTTTNIEVLSVLVRAAHNSVLSILVHTNVPFVLIEALHAPKRRLVVEALSRMLDVAMAIPSTIQPSWIDEVIRQFIRVVRDTTCRAAIVGIAQNHKEAFKKFTTKSSSK